MTLREGLGGERCYLHSSTRQVQPVSRNSSPFF